MDSKNDNESESTPHSSENLEENPEEQVENPSEISVVVLSEGQPSESSSGSPEEQSSMVPRKRALPTLTEEMPKNKHIRFS